MSYTDYLRDLLAVDKGEKKYVLTATDAGVSIVDFKPSGTKITPSEIQTLGDFKDGYEYNLVPNIMPDSVICAITDAREIREDVPRALSPFEEIQPIYGNFVCFNAKRHSLLGNNVLLVNTMTLMECVLTIGGLFWRFDMTSEKINYGRMGYDDEN